MPRLNGRVFGRAATSARLRVESRGIFADTRGMKTRPSTPSALLIPILILALLPTGIGAETFRFKYIEGDSYRVNSTVRESVYQNRVLAYSTDITNRITVAVSDVRPGTGGGLESALQTCTFMTSERALSQTYEWGREYISAFRRDALGFYDIPSDAFMPVVRNVPTFPDRDVKIGETWTGTGEEAHDLRDTFGIETPFKVPFTVTYAYKGPVERNGKKLHLIEAEYTMLFNSPKKTGLKAAESRDYPVSTMGYSRQKIYFDNELGLVPYYSEDFRIQLTLASGSVFEFRGTAEAIVTETKLMDRTQAAKEMNEEISRLGIADARASATEDGITISLENIQFEADSANLLPSERVKIAKLAALLERYPDKDLLVSGHTALAGTVASRQKLSEERAAAVAREIVALGVRNDYNVYTQGFGADKPLVPNTSEENRARNRRVEITILEK